METNKEKRKRSAKVLLKGVGVLLFLWIFYSIDRTALWTHLKDANVKLLLLSCVAMLGVYFSRAVKWHLIVQKNYQEETFLRSWWWYNIGIFLGNVTPGKIGELGRSLQLTKKGTSKKTAIGLLLFDRAMDLGFMALFSLISASIVFSPLWGEMGALLLFLGIALWLSSKRWKIVPQKMQEWIQPFFSARFGPGMMIVFFLLTGLSWLLYFWWALTLAWSIGIDVSFLDLASVFTLTAGVSILGIAPVGLGTRDASLIFLLGMYGVSSSQAVALALLMFTSTLVMSLLGGYYWLRLRN